jgi:hypothetical protein
VTNVALVLVGLLVVWFVLGVLRKRGGIVARRGLSIGADLAAMADQPRVRVQTVRIEGPDRVRLVLTPAAGPDDGQGLTTPSDLDLVVSLHQDDFGFELLRKWKLSESSLAIVMPPSSRIVRLRSIDDLQPLTLRRADEG